MQCLNNTLVEFNHYINGGSPKRLKHYMHYYKDNLFELNQHCNRAINHASIIKQIHQILSDLAIPPARWDDYFHPPLAVYDFLLKLHRQGYIQIGYILRLINNKLSTPKWVYITAILFISGLTVVLLSKSSLALLFTIVQSFITSPIGYPILGIILSLGLALFNLYHSINNHSKPKVVRIRDIIFTLMYTALNILGYSLLIKAQIAMTPLVASIFIMGSFLDVVKESLALAQGYWRYHYGSGGKGVGYLYSVRNKYSFIKHRNAALINLAVAATIVMIMIVWCVMPANIAITIAAIVLMTVLYSAKAGFSKLNEQQTRRRLQKEIKSTNTALAGPNIRFQTRDNIIQDIVFAVNSATDPERLRKQFISKYEKTLTPENKIAFFKLFNNSRFDYRHASLTDILTHGLLEEGRRTKKILLELKWINKYDHITLPMSDDRQIKLEFSKSEFKVHHC